MPTSSFLTTVFVFFVFPPLPEQLTFFPYFYFKMQGDIPLVMRVAFYLDNITFHEKKEDSEELFNKPNSYKKIMLHLENYLKYMKRKADVTTERLNFDDFLEFMVFYLKKDEQVFLKHYEESEYR